MQAELKLSKKISVYFLSIILAPIGIYWFIKYFKNPNAKIRTVGYTALFLTIATIILTTVISVYYISTIEGYIGSYEKSLDQYNTIVY